MAPKTTEIAATAAEESFGPDPTPSTHAPRKKYPRSGEPLTSIIHHQVKENSSFCCFVVPVVFVDAETNEIIDKNVSDNKLNETINQMKKENTPIMQMNIGILEDGYMIIIRGMNIKKVMMNGIQFVRYLLIIVTLPMDVMMRENKSIAI